MCLYLKNVSVKALCIKNIIVYLQIKLIDYGKRNSD